MSNFVHLRTHSSLSIKDGLLSGKDLASLAAEKQQPAIALTDLNRMFGIITFYEAAVNKGVKPIIGCDAYIERDLTDPDEFENEEIPTRLLLIAKNDKGYKRLMELQTRSYIENMKGEPKNEIAYIKQSWLKEDCDGLIALSGDVYSGDIALEMLKEDRDINESKKIALEKANFYKDIFKGNFFLEIQRYDQKKEAEFVEGIVSLSHETNIPLVATHPVQFKERGDYYAHELRTTIPEKEQIVDITRSTKFTREQYFKSSEEMEELFSDIPFALDNAKSIAKMCSVKIKLNSNDLPKYPTSNGESEADYFERVSKEGLEERLTYIFPDEKERKEKRAEYDERLQTEIDIIKKMDFPGYFLIVSDFIKWSKNNEVPVGPGRGSGAGSLVAYSLKITDLDPLPYGLLFERFLNPERVSMPDFDIDFDSTQRHKVISYVRDKYDSLSGGNSVAQIATYSLLKAKAVIKDVGRSMAIPLYVLNRISKMMPSDPKLKLKDMFNDSRFRQVYEESSQMKKLIDTSLLLENVPKTVGMHAGGIVIAPGKISDYTPIYVADNENGVTMSQYDKDGVEKAGLVKFDFLALANLTSIDMAVKMINDREEFKDKKFDISTISLTDKKIFENFSKGNSIGVFQFESPGMRGMLKSIKPDRFEDLIALVSLYRPGPMALIPEYKRRKEGGAFEYPDPRAESSLKETYGIMIYQEQVMQVAQQVANYTLGGADMLRRAMGKKKHEEMVKQREIFRSGANQNGVSSEKADEIFDLMEKFADYGFNKSHAAAYALVSYQTAYLKTHYPTEYYTAMLNTNTDNTDKIDVFLQDARLNGLNVLPPDINTCNTVFVGEGNSLMFGIAGIKGVKEDALSSVKDELEKNGKYQSFPDFYKRVGMKIRKNVVQKMIMAGVFDSLEPNRAKIYESLELFAEYSKKVKAQDKKVLTNIEREKENIEIQRKIDAGELNEKGKPFKLKKLAEIQTIELPEMLDVEPWVSADKYDRELKAYGFFLTGHPFPEIKAEMGGLKAALPLSDIDVVEPETNESFLIAGIISSLEIKSTVNGDKMALIKLDDGETIKSLLIFSRVMEDMQDELTVGKTAAFEIQVQKPKEGREEDGNRVNIRNYFSLNDLKHRLVNGIHIAIKPERMSDFTTLLEKHKGTMPVTLYHPEKNSDTRYTMTVLDNKKHGISGTPECIKELEEFAGKNLVKMNYSNKPVFQQSVKVKPRPRY